MVQWYPDWRLIPEHMHGGVQRYVHHGVLPGAFLRAVIRNDFIEAYKRADDENRERIVGWLEFISYHMPIGSAGSDRAMTDWCAAGGLDGIYGRREKHDRKKAG